MEVSPGLISRFLIPARSGILSFLFNTGWEKPMDVVFPGAHGLSENRLITSIKFQQDTDFVFYLSRDLVTAIRAEITHQVPDGFFKFKTGDSMLFMVQGFFRWVRVHGYRGQFLHRNGFEPRTRMK